MPIKVLQIWGQRISSPLIFSFRLMGLNHFKLTLLMLSILLFGCGDKMALPPVTSSPESFGANDTSYIHLEPDWSAATMGYFAANPMRPVDIAIGADSYIFIADQGNNKVFAVTESGQLITSYNMYGISNIENPLAIDIDPKLNLLIVNGTNKIYVWNQFINVAGITAVILDTTETGAFIFNENQSVIDSVLNLHAFYTDPNENASFQGVTFGPPADNTVFVTDKFDNRILRLNIEISAAVQLTRGELYPLFKGVYSDDIANFGSGAGTVDNPRGITCDNEGNIYFTQLGGNFMVQRLNKIGDVFSSAYTLYEDPIMDLGRFLGPPDIALGENDAIFIIDTPDSGRVSKFFNRGSYAGRPANLGKKGLVDARFNSPMSIAISDKEVVYIANTNDHRIERFQYSVSEDDLPQEPL
jgi:hypothetical protein